MRVATFNIKHGAQERGQLGDPRAVAEACVELDADVIALQEVDTRTVRSQLRDTVALAAAATGMQQIFAPTMRIFGGRYGNALLFRGEETSPHSVVDVVGGPRHRKKVAGKSHEFGREPRNAILAHLVVDGDEFSVAATHLATAPNAARAGLVKVLDLLKETDEKQLILGDFNLTLPGFPSSMLPPGFERVVAPPGFPASNPRRAIDHIMTRGFTVESVEMHQMPISDHRALVAEIHPAE